MKTRAMVFSLCSPKPIARLASPCATRVQPGLGPRLLAAFVSAYSPSQIVRSRQFTGARNDHPPAQFPFDRPGEARPAEHALRQRPDVAELGAGDAPEGLVPRTLLLTGAQDGFSGALLACSDPERLAEVMAESGLSDAA